MSTAAIGKPVRPGPADDLCPPEHLVPEAADVERVAADDDGREHLANEVGDHRLGAAMVAGE